MRRLLLILSLLLAPCSALLSGPFFLGQQGVIASASTTYTPPTANLVLWLSARKETAFSDGAAVETPTDWSGAGNAPTQATSTSRPSYETAEINGLPTFRLDGVDDRWLFSGTALDIAKNVGGLTVYVVSKSTSTATARTTVGFTSGTSTTANRFFVGHTSGSKLRSGGRRTDADTLQEVNGTATYSSGTWYLSTAVFNYTNSDLNQYLNGTSDGSSTTFQTDGSTSNTSSQAATIGASSAVSSIFWTGDIAEVLIYQTAHDSTTRSAIETGLRGIYGL